MTRPPAAALHGSQKAKVTCVTQVPELTSLPGLQALKLKAESNAPLCGMDVLDFNLLKSAELTDPGNEPKLSMLYQDQRL